MFLNILSKFLKSEGDTFGLFPDLGKVVVHLNTLYLLV